MTKITANRAFRLTPFRAIVLMIPLMIIYAVSNLQCAQSDANAPKVGSIGNLDASSKPINHLDSPDYSACTSDGLVGSLNRDSILTLIVSPKAPPSSAAKHSNETLFAWYRDQFLYESRASLPGVDFVIASRDCTALLLARSYGLPTYRLGAHTNDVEAASYRHIMNAVHNGIGAESPFIGFANGDILFDTSLVDTMRGVMYFRESRGQKNVGIFGRRINVDVESSALQPSFTLDQRLSNVNDAVKSNGTLFGARAVDYFIWNRELPLEFGCFPPHLLGGVTFDNWFTGLMNHYEGVATIDATDSLAAVHINHDSHRNKSHFSLASIFNKRVNRRMTNFKTTSLKYAASMIESGVVRVQKRETFPVRTAAYDWVFSCFNDARLASLERAV
ncbi:hypothetical protein BJ741DRAFT_637091 [Chytriomyces cf. hyalinus JEL632]|nr:hypothetical protein BJ741DRAFT_637091 [Chytriomyces cf. hyalinus JEL632]